MEAIYKKLTEAWLAVDGRLSFIKPLWARIAVVVFIAMIVVNLLSSLIPLAFGIAVAAGIAVLLFKALHEKE